MKKLEKGEGVWEVEKEILGWIFNGLHRTIAYPDDKFAKIKKLLKEATRKNKIKFKKLEKLNGKLRHASIGMPWIKGLFTPIIQALKTTHSHINISKGTLLRETLTDFSTLITAIHREPATATQLAPNYPRYLGKCDASKFAAGGSGLMCWDTCHQ